MSATLTCSPVDNNMSISRAGGFFVNFSGQSDQRVGIFAHGADDHHHLVALLVGSDSLAGGGEDFFTVCDTGSAKLLND